jgi:hypothetical protein
MKEYYNPYTKKIHAVLVPLVGDIVATGILKSQATKLGKVEESLVPEDSPMIAEGLRKGLVLFIGSEAANQLSSKIGQIR